MSLNSIPSDISVSEMTTTTTVTVTSSLDKLLLPITVRYGKKAGILYVLGHRNWPEDVYKFGKSGDKPPSASDEDEHISSYSTDAKPSKVIVSRFRGYNSHGPVPVDIIAAYICTDLKHVEQHLIQLLRFCRYNLFKQGEREYVHLELQYLLRLIESTLELADDRNWLEEIGLPVYRTYTHGCGDLCKHRNSRKVQEGALPKPNTLPVPDQLMRALHHKSSHLLKREHQQLQLASSQATRTTSSSTIAPKPRPITAVAVDTRYASYLQTIRGPEQEVPVEPQSLVQSQEKLIQAVFPEYGLRQSVSAVECSAQFPGLRFLRPCNSNPTANTTNTPNNNIHSSNAASTSNRNSNSLAMDIDLESNLAFRPATANSDDDNTTWLQMEQRVEQALIAMQQKAEQARQAQQALQAQEEEARRQETTQSRMILGNIEHIDSSASVLLLKPNQHSESHLKRKREWTSTYASESDRIAKSLRTWF